MACPVRKRPGGILIRLVLRTCAGTWALHQLRTISSTKMAALCPSPSCENENSHSDFGSLKQWMTVFSLDPRRSSPLATGSNEQLGQVDTPVSTLSLTQG
jgi:hypothetical protein